MTMTMTMTTLKPNLPKRGASCPAPTVLEALSVGEPQPPAVEAHVPGCDACHTYVASLQAEQADFGKMRPPEQFFRKLARRESAPPARRPWFAAAFGAILAATLAVLVLPAVLTGPRDDGVLTKGAAFKVVSLRPGSDSPRLVEQDSRLKAGDALRFSYDAPEAGHLLVLDLDGTGKASVFVPFQATRSLPIAAGNREMLPGSVVLDTASGAEWLVAVFAKKPLEARPLLDALEAQSGATDPKLTCDGCTVSVLRIQKSP